MQHHHPSLITMDVHVHDMAPHINMKMHHQQ